MRNTAVLILDIALLLAAGNASAQEHPRALPEPRVRIETALSGRGWLGFSYDVVTRARATQHDSMRAANTTTKVIVREVRPRSPAARGGLLTGDTIVSI